MPYPTFSPLGIPASDLLINTGSPWARGLTAIWRVVPGRGLAFINLLRGWVRYYDPVNLLTTPTGELACWGASISNAEIDDVQVTSGDWALLCWFHTFAAPGNGEYIQVIGDAAYVNESNNQGWSLQVDANDATESKEPNMKVFRNNGGASYAHEFDRQVVSGTGNFCAVTSIVSGASNTINTFYNGVYNKTESVNVNPVSSAGNLTFGGKATTSHQGFIEAWMYTAASGPLATMFQGDAAAWFRALHQNQARYDLFAPISHRAYFSPGLTATAGGGARSQVIICG